MARVREAVEEGCHLRVAGAKQVLEDEDSTPAPPGQSLTEDHMAADPSTMNDPKLVRQLLENAEKREAHDLAAACRRRLFQLGGIDVDDPVERRLWEAVTALEETYREKHGRAQAAGYTRRKIRDAGAVATLSDWAMKPEVTPGFIALVAAGMSEFTGEYVIAQYPDRFEPHVVEAAKRRLIEYGVPLP